MQTLLITGGAGFIGGCLVRRAVSSGQYRIINLDALTYAGNLDSIPEEGPNMSLFRAISEIKNSYRSC